MHVLSLYFSIFCIYLVTILALGAIRGVLKIGVTQGGPVSPRIFNILVDAVVQEWLWQTIDEGKDEVVVNGLGEWVQYLLADFYADDALIQCRQADVLQ